MRCLNPRLSQDVLQRLVLAQLVIRESADLVYQLVVLWRACDIASDEVWGEMRHRADTLGIAEKLPKPAAHIALAVGRGV
jgi:hypothetical protein